MSDITKDDLIEANRLLLVALVIGIAMGALLVSIPVLAMHPSELRECNKEKS